MPPDGEPSNIAAEADGARLVAQQEESAVDENNVNSILSLLSNEEVEGAARCSYSYYIASIENQSTPSYRNRMAAATICRHLVAHDGDCDKALHSVKDTVQHRSSLNVDEIRQCFVGSSNECIELKEGIEREIHTGHCFVRGYDKEQRALLHCVTRHALLQKDPVAYVKMCVYTLERAIACSRHGMVSVCVDFQDFRLSHAAPMSVIKELLNMLRDHYPERLHRMYLVDANVVFRGLWKLIKPFVDPVTKTKVQFVTGSEQRREVFGSDVGVEQCMAYMMEDGHLKDDLDVKTYLYETPYDKAIGAENEREMM